MSILLRRGKKNPISAVRNFYYRRVQEGCECPEPEKKYVVEKECGCCFTRWKPKPRKMLECEMKRDLKQPQPPKRCYAGMGQHKIPDCDPAAIDPFKGHCCKETKRTTPPPLTKKKETLLPTADWDVDC